MKIIIDNDVITATIGVAEDANINEVMSEVIIPALRLAGYSEDIIKDAMREAAK